MYKTRGTRGLSKIKCVWADGEGDKVILQGEFTFYYSRIGCPPINDVERAKNNALVKNFTSTDFLVPIRMDSSNGGTSDSRIKKT